MRKRNVVCLALGALLAAACSDGTPAPAGVTVTTGSAPAVIIQSPRSAAVVGQTQQLSLTITYSGGVQVTTTSGAVWSTSNSAIATISQSGLLTAHAFGIVSVTATTKDFSRSLTMPVVIDAAGQWAFQASPELRSERFTVEQSGGQLTGEWVRGGAQRIPLTGTASHTGDIFLTGERCVFVAEFVDQLLAVREWRVKLDPVTGTYSGSAIVSESAPGPAGCPNAQATNSTTYTISNFRRVN